MGVLGRSDARNYLFLLEAAVYSSNRKKSLIKNTLS